MRLKGKYVETIVNEMPFERDASLWYPIWDLTTLTTLKFLESRPRL